MAEKDTNKTYEQITHKLHNNFQDVRHLIALYNLVLDEINRLNKRLDRLWKAVNVIYEETD